MRLVAPSGAIWTWKTHPTHYRSSKARPSNLVKWWHKHEPWPTRNLSLKAIRRRGGWPSLDVSEGCREIHPHLAPGACKSEIDSHSRCPASILITSASRSPNIWRVAPPQPRRHRACPRACMITAVARDQERAQRGVAILEILPIRSSPPLELLRGVRPIQAAKCLPEAKAAGSGASASSVAAVIGPTPRIVSADALSGWRERP